MTQTQLLQAFWGAAHIDNSHCSRIVGSYLRQKLGDDPAEPHNIRTEAGVGYRLMYEERKSG